MTFYRYTHLKLDISFVQKENLSQPKKWRDAPEFKPYWGGAGVHFKFDSGFTIKKTSSATLVTSQDYSLKSLFYSYLKIEISAECTRH